MKKLMLCVLAVMLITCPLWAEEVGQVVPGHYIVVLKDSAAVAGVSGQQVCDRHGLAGTVAYTAALHGFAAEISEADLPFVEADPQVKYVEPDLVVHALGAPVVQTLPTGINRIDADLSPLAKIDGIDERVNVDLAVIDTGVSRDHTDLNFFRGFTAPGILSKKPGGDNNGHGSHVAGTAAAIDNGFGVVGVAPGARLWAAKVLDQFGSGTVATVIAGVDWVTANADAIEVANMSLGGIGHSQALRDAIRASVAEGVVYVVSAGNSARDLYGPDGVLGTSDDAFPAAYTEVAAVSAIADSDGTPGHLGSSTKWGGDDTFASFSNFSGSVDASNPVSSPGAAMDLAAPGVNIYSTWLGKKYNTLSGTSMSSPHVAGLAALYVAKNGRAIDAAGVAAVRQALIDLGDLQGGADGFTGDPDANPEPLADAHTL